MAAATDCEWPRRLRRVRFGWIIMGTLGGAVLGSFFAPGATDGPRQDLLFAPCWFWGAIVGALFAISVQIIVRLCRGLFRARVGSASRWRSGWLACFC